MATSTASPPEPEPPEPDPSGSGTAGSGTAGSDLPDRDDPAPFGLPVLAEVPELAALLELAVEADRSVARLVEAIILIRETGLAEAATGVALEQWLAVVGRRTRADRRMLITAAEVCRRLPSLRTAFATGRVSWAQLRTVALQVTRLPRHLDDRLDHELASAIDGAADADPDALARVVDWTLAALTPSDDEPAGAPDADVLILQPRLDGSGGRLWGDLGPVGFAAVDAATDPGPTGTASRDRFGAPPDPDRAAANRTTSGRARAARLVDLCRRGDDGEVRPPVLLLRAELDTLLATPAGRGGLPAQLLTTLAGGAMHVDHTTARRLADAYGADLRLIVLDHGRVVGIGTRTRQPPRWLTDATLALHDTCTEPGCLVAARVCDTDHAIPVSHDGTTDIGQIAPLCATGNHRKEADGWTARQTTDGTRTWHHPRTGLTTRTLPATWRPPPHTTDPPRDHEESPDGTDPPDGADPACGTDLPCGPDAPGATDPPAAGAGPPDGSASDCASAPRDPPLPF